MHHPMHPMPPLPAQARTITLTSEDIAHTRLRTQRIEAADLPLFARHDLTDWNGQPFDPELLCRLGKWWVNDDKSVIFKDLGGGSFEIPEMHALVWRGAKVHIECGGGGDRACVLTVNAAGGLDVVVHVTRIAIPPELAHDTDAVLAQVAEAFAVRHLPAGAQGSVTVNFGPRAPAPSRPTIP